MTKLMTRIVVGCLGLAACATAGGAGALTIDVGAPRLVGFMTSIPVTLTNGGAHAHDKVAVTCSFFDAEGRTLTSSRAYLPAIAPGASQSETLLLDPNLGEVARHDCKVD